MTSAFNPYVQWLGLNIAGQPDCYTLIALPWYEADPAKILAAADQAYARVQAQQAGINEATKQALLSEILTARACLLDPTSKATYDRQLQMSMQQYQAAVPHPPPLVPTTSNAPRAVPIKGKKSAASRARKEAFNASKKAKSRNLRYLVFGIALLVNIGIGVGYQFLPLKVNTPVENNPQKKPKNTDLKLKQSSHWDIVADFKGIS